MRKIREIGRHNKRQRTVHVSNEIRRHEGTNNVEQNGADGNDVFVVDRLDVSTDRRDDPYIIS